MTLVEARDLQKIANYLADAADLLVEGLELAAQGHDTLEGRAELLLEIRRASAVLVGTAVLYPAPVARESA